MGTLRAAYATAADFLTTFDGELSKAGLLVRGAQLENAVAGHPCQVSVEVAGEPPVEVPAQVAAVVPGVGVAVLFSGVPSALSALAQRLRGGGAPVEAPAAEPPQPEEEVDEKEPPRGTLYDRLKAMTVSQKTHLALSGQRDERLALLRDPVKPVHVFVLKNPRIGIDEIQYAAKLAGLSPDALKMIADHREWSSNATVCSALVRNPKTPLPLALRLLDRVPLTELKAIAKGGARDQVVQAARRKLSQ